MTVATEPKLEPYIRGKKGFYVLQENPFGRYYRKIDDPKGVPEPENLEYFYLNHELAKIPQELVQAIVSFFRAYLRKERGAPFNLKKAYSDSSTEAQVCLLQKEDDPSEWKVVVPRQVVGAVTVDALTQYSCDIITGEEYDVFPPIGYLHAGSFHSHNHMKSFWSSRDDEGELGVPGLHCTVGQLTQDSFEICASVVQNRKRYVFDPILFLDVPERDTKSTGEKTQSRMIRLSSLEVHPNVHKYVTQRGAAVVAGGKSKGGLFGKTKQSNDDFSDFKALSRWRDEVRAGNNLSYEDWYADYVGSYGLNGYWEGDDYQYRIDPVNDSVESIQLELEEMYGATSTSFTKGFLLEGKYLQEVPEEEKLVIKQDAIQMRQLIKRLGQTDLGHLWFIKIIAEELGVVIDPAIDDTIDHHHYFPTK